MKNTSKHTAGKIGVGIIGASPHRGWALTAHVPALKSLPGYEIRADRSSSYLVDARNGATLLTIPFGHTVDALCYCLGEFTELTATTATRRPIVRLSGTDETIPMTGKDYAPPTAKKAGGEQEVCEGIRA